MNSNVELLKRWLAILGNDCQMEGGSAYAGLMNELPTLEKMVNSLTREELVGYLKERTGNYIETNDINAGELTFEFVVESIIAKLVDDTRAVSSEVNEDADDINHDVVNSDEKPKVAFKSDHGFGSWVIIRNIENSKLSVIDDEIDVARAVQLELLSRLIYDIKRSFDDITIYRQMLKVTRNFLTEHLSGGKELIDIQNTLDRLNYYNGGMSEFDEQLTKTIIDTIELVANKYLLNQVILREVYETYGENRAVKSLVMQLSHKFANPSPDINHIKLVNNMFNRELTNHVTNLLTINQLVNYYDIPRLTSALYECGNDHRVYRETLLGSLKLLTTLDTSVDLIENVKSQFVGNVSEFIKRLCEEIDITAGNIVGNDIAFDKKALLVALDKVMGSDADVVKNLDVYVNLRRHCSHTAWFTFYIETVKIFDETLRLRKREVEVEKYTSSFIESLSQLINELDGTALDIASDALKHSIKLLPAASLESRLSSLVYKTCAILCMHNSVTRIETTFDDKDPNEWMSKVCEKIKTVYNERHKAEVNDNDYNDLTDNVKQVLYSTLGRYVRVNNRPVFDKLIRDANLNVSNYEATLESLLLSIVTLIVKEDSARACCGEIALLPKTYNDVVGYRKYLTNSVIPVLNKYS